MVTKAGWHLSEIKARVGTRLRGLPHCFVCNTLDCASSHAAECLGELHCSAGAVGEGLEGNGDSEIRARLQGARHAVLGTFIYFWALSLENVS